MEEAKTLIRTTVRTFFPHPKQILIVDALMLHSVLHIEDLAVLLSSQPKDIRSFINPLRSARLLATHSRVEVRVGATRGVTRDYYYSPFHPAIDAIKYRIAKLRKKVEALYQQDETKRKDWRCPRCKAEYEELEILDKIGEEGFYCDRCGTTLVQNEQAAQDRGNHEKIRRLNSQLKKFDDMVEKVDRKTIPENDFHSAWERKKDVPRDKGGRSESQYVELKRDIKREGKGPELVKAENLAINLTSGAEREKEEAEKKEERRRQLAKQNLLPVWHTSSAIGQNSNSSTTPGAVSVKSENEPNGLTPKKEEEDEKEKKPDISTLQDEVAAYMAEMERERVEADRKAKEEDAEDDEDDGDFEDVIGASNIGTPASSQQMQLDSTSATRPTNGIKREYDDDDDSGPSSDANTPASFGSGDRDPKRVKFENSTLKVTSEPTGINGRVMTTTMNSIKPEQSADADSEEDEDFEDAM